MKNVVTGQMTYIVRHAMTATASGDECNCLHVMRPPEFSLQRRLMKYSASWISPEN